MDNKMKCMDWVLTLPILKRIIDDLTNSDQEITYSNIESWYKKYKEIVDDMYNTDNTDWHVQELSHQWWIEYDGIKFNL